MELVAELERAKIVLNEDRSVKYKQEMDGENTFEVSEGKFITVVGGQEKHLDLRDAYDSLFVDPDVPATEGGVKQADGTLTNCTQAEWDVLLKEMRMGGRILFEKSETLATMIDALVDTDTFETIWNTTWENLVL